MQSRATRFWLRFDSGPRQGETVPLTEGTLSVGRRSANKIVLGDGSISGFHAELHVSSSSVEVVDLESTNGTKVGTRKIERSALAHGDVVTFGNIASTLLDHEFLGARIDSPQAAGDGLERVGERELAAAGKRGILAPILLVGAIAGGGAALFFMRGGSSGEDRAAQVSEVAGNHIADGTFELYGGAAWETSEASTEAFYSDSGFASTGRAGFGVFLDPVEVEEGEAPVEPWSYASSAEHSVSSGRGMRLSVDVLSEGAATGRVGLAFRSERGEGLAFVAWARGVRDSGDFTTCTLTAAVPPGYDRVAVAVAARGVGSVAVDNVVLLDTTAPAPLASADNLEAYGYGSDGTQLTVVRSGRAMFPSIGFGNWSAGGLRGSSQGSWSASATPSGLALEPRGANPGSTLHVVAYGRQDAEAGDVFIASLGPDGYRAHAASFEVPAVTDLLLGSGYDLLRLSVGGVSAVQGRVRDGVLLLALSGASTSALTLQGSFAEERAEARRLQSDAEEAERSGRPGESLAAWQRLLDELPFEAEIVQRAELERARLIQEGLDRVDGVRREVERARFFELADLFRQSLGNALDIAASYRGTEVAREANIVAVEIEQALVELTEGAANVNEQRIEGVLRALSDDESTKLRAYVREALNAAAQERTGASGSGNAHDGQQGLEDHD